MCLLYGNWDILDSLTPTVEPIVAGDYPYLVGRIHMSHKERSCITRSYIIYDI